MLSRQISGVKIESQKETPELSPEATPIQVFVFFWDNLKIVRQFVRQHFWKSEEDPPTPMDLSAEIPPTPSPELLDDLPNIFLKQIFLKKSKMFGEVYCLSNRQYNIWYHPHKGQPLHTSTHQMYGQYRQHQCFLNDFLNEKIESPKNNIF